MAKPIIEVSSLSKKYRLGKIGTTSFREEVNRWWTDVRAGSARQKRPPDNRDFWSLKDVSFGVERGEVLGIVGKNGAGKSTLLKIMSRITEPTGGEIRIRGRVASLLEVGTGFHPELSGEENIYLNGALLGMSRAEVRSKFNAIVEFSEVGDFISTPVKRYSSGMYVRLAFAVAAHLEPDILIIDEVLAVGDASFQEKCLGKMREVSRGGGRTVIFVSHQMATVKNLCSRVVWLHRGQVRDIGPSEKLVVDYLTETNSKQGISKSEHGLELAEIAFADSSGRDTITQLIFSESYSLRVRITSAETFSRAAIVVQIKNGFGDLVSSVCTPEEGIDPFELKTAAQLNVSFSPLRLLPGKYFVDVFVFRPNDTTRYLEAENALSFEVHPAIIADSMWPYQSHHGTARLADQVSLLA